MDVTTIASLGAMLAGLTTLAIALNHWQETYSRQQDEIRRLAESRSKLARKFVRQLRQARLYTNLENEYCERLASVADSHLDVSLSYLGSIPLDPYLKRAVQERRPVVSAYPRSPAALAFSSCAEQMLRSSVESSTSGLSFFVESLWADTQSTE